MSADPTILRRADELALAQTLVFVPLEAFFQRAGHTEELHVIRGTQAVPGCFSQGMSSTRERAVPGAPGGFENYIWGTTVYNTGIVEILTVENDPATTAVVANGIYQIKNLNSGAAALEVPSGHTTAGTLTDQSTYTGGTNQQWKVTRLSNGNYTIASVNTGLFLDVFDNSDASGAAVDVWTANGQTNQEWTFSGTNDANYIIKSVSGTFPPPPGQPLFGSIGDSVPDTWGRRLMRRAERRQSDREHRAVRTLTESNYLLGVADETRFGALRFRWVGDELFQAPPRTGCSWEMAVPSRISPRCCRCRQRRRALGSSPKMSRSRWRMASVKRLLEPHTLHLRLAVKELMFQRGTYMQS